MTNELNWKTWREGVDRCVDGELRGGLQLRSSCRLARRLHTVSIIAGMVHVLDGSPD